MPSDDKQLPFQPEAPAMCRGLINFPKETCSRIIGVELLGKTGHVTQVKRNANLAKLPTRLVFPEIRRIVSAYCEKHPDAKIISLGIGDTTEPIPAVITSAMAQHAQSLSTPDGYRGYGNEQGDESLRYAIIESFYKGLGVEKTEVFLSDGAKGSATRLQVVLGENNTVALQDPLYPIFAGLCALSGKTGTFMEDLHQYDKVEYMKCVPENNFFPDLSLVSRTDIIIFCSPNNPTGCAATREQLEQLVTFAKRNGSIIIYDSVYAMYISDEQPKSIYEIPGAREVAIELGSFSKYAAFTGVRLGWAVIPKELRFADGCPVIKDFLQVSCLSSMGPSNIAQAGGLACLSPGGMEAMKETIGFYKENAKILVDTFLSLGLKAYGGKNAPFVWVQFPGKRSLDVFNEILEKAHIVCVPGDAFGPSGKGFLRFSAFGHRENILEAAKRLRYLYGKPSV